MARQLLQKCTACGKYGLSETCQHCGGKAEVAGPMKFSPEDSRADLRRRLKKVEEKKWAESLPSPDGGEEE